MCWAIIVAPLPPKRYIYYDINWDIVKYPTYEVQLKVG